MATGPRTEPGKTVSSMNAYKHGMRSAEYRATEALIAFYGRKERAMRQEIKER